LNNEFIFLAFSFVNNSNVFSDITTFDSSFERALIAESLSVRGANRHVHHWARYVTVAAASAPFAGPMINMGQIWLVVTNFLVLDFAHTGVCYSIASTVLFNAHRTDPRVAVWCSKNADKKEGKKFHFDILDFTSQKLI